MAKAKRDNGEFRVRKRGKKYQAEASLGYHPITGNRITKSFTRVTKKEATDAARAYQAEWDRGIDITGGQELLSVYLEKWYEGYLSKRHLRDSSERRYQEFINRINKTLGNVPVSMVTPLHLDLLVRENRNLASLHKVYAFLGRAFEDAIRYDLITQSPFLKHDAPRKPERKEIEFLDEKEIGQLIAGVQGQWIGEMIIFALNSGCRAGELIGAQWDDLEYKDDGSGAITIRRSVRTNTSGEYVVSGPKTAKGYRTIELSAPIMRVLDRKREINNARKIIAPYWNEIGNGLIFANRVGGHHSGSNLLKELKRIAKDSGIKKNINLKTLRHSSATLAIKNGMDLHTLKNRMGHTDIGITSNIYGHLFSGQQESAATMLDKYLVD
jgi:integrase